jgi:glycosyltransferase involved in cell wall biosynthesis
MHVLHVVQLYRPVPSGAAAYFVEVGERLAREGHRVTVLTTDAFDLEHFWLPGRRSISESTDEHGGVQVRRFPVWRAPGPPLTYPVLRRLMVELGRLLPAPLAVPLLRRLAALTPRLPTLSPYLRGSPELSDVALVHTTNITLDFAMLPVLRWAEQRGIPHLCTPFVHLGEPGNRQVLRYYSMPHQVDILRRSARVIVQTSLERRFLRAAGVPDERMRTIGVGVTPAELSGGDGARFRREQQIEGPIVLTIGTAAHDKGTPHVVQAMQRLWQQGHRATWVQVGPLMEHFERQYAALPAADRARTRVLGFVPDQVRRDALAAADVFALPSRTDSFGIVYLEAWCYGLPVVGAWAGGVPDVIDHGVNGLLVPFGDVAALAGALARLLADRQLAQAFGRLGRAKVERELTWEHKYALVRRAYAEVVGAEKKPDHQQSS